MTNRHSAQIANDTRLKYKMDVDFTPKELLKISWNSNSCFLKGYFYTLNNWFFLFIS